MEDNFYDQGWRRRYNRFEGFDDDFELCNIKPPKRGNSTRAINRPYRPDHYLEAHHSPLENACEFRESYPPNANYDSPNRSNGYGRKSYNQDRNSQGSVYDSPTRGQAYDPNIYSRDSYARKSLYDSPKWNKAYNKYNYSQERFRSKDSWERWEHHSPSRRHENTHLDYHKADPEVFSPSRAFKEDVLKVLNPLIKEIRASSATPEKETAKNIIEVNVEEAHKQAQEVKNELLNMISKNQKEIEDVNKVILQQNPNIIKRLDTLTDKYNQIKDIKPQPCQWKCKGSLPEDTKKIDAKVSSAYDTLGTHENQLQVIIKELKALKKKESESKQPNFEELFNKINSLEKLNDEISEKYENLVSKLEQTNKTVSQIDQNWDKKIKQIKIPDIQNLNFVSPDEINELISQIDTKLNQVGKLSDNNLKTQIKTIEESQNKSQKEVDKKIKGRNIM